MIILGNLLIAVGQLLGTILWFYGLLIIAAAVLSWVSPDPRNPIVQFIYGATEPLLAKVRGKIPPLGFLDISPIAVLLAIYFLDAFLVKTLLDYGNQFRGSTVGQVGF